ncbi:hypothetical protein COPG_00093 [Colwellia phage 9A]|uniref:Uncharacterized protein n=1 Tax=Colwellia phage 9A TaxID=765765 RepID=I3UMH4_9CAUD|nr:hypothetical protein COPG_00093 [Colwellia phage 9A]AFK66689.1 hypothetical protein COPG_00093 [Colwellia phage 9A]
MAIEYYDKAEIYFTTCIHPEFSYLKYVGLDTKCDPNYMGSSVTLKWFMNKIGRSYFKKQILEVCSGTMREICRVEQKYIVKHKAVKDPNYLNMSGGLSRSLSEDCIVTLEYVLQPTETIAQDFINETVNRMKESIKFFNHSRQQLTRRILSMAIYGYLKYEQESFDYNRYTYYGSCTDEDLQGILSAMANLNILDSGFSTITITQAFIEDIPLEVAYTDFDVKNNQ